MKLYAISSLSRYRYSSAASHGYHLARLMPLAGEGQSLERASLDVSPAPYHRGLERDFFGNQVDWFSLDGKHSDLVFTMNAQVRIARPPSLLTPTLSWEDAVSAAQRVNSLGPQSPAHFLRSTPRTLADAPIRDFAARFFTPGASVSDASLAMSKAIQSELRYDSGATDVETTASAAFQNGAGVCQDFAHIMIAACTSIGLPARYVSGYIRTNPPPGEPRLEGADAMHAWVSVWTGPVAGWIDHDPTNGCLVGEDHITVAFGRDYQDVPPIRGEVVGGGEQSHTVAVDVVEIA